MLESGLFLLEIKVGRARLSELLADSCAKDRGLVFQFLDFAPVIVECGQWSVDKQSTEPENSAAQKTAVVDIWAGKSCVFEAPIRKTELDLQLKPAVTVLLVCGLGSGTRSVQLIASTCVGTNYGASVGDKIDAELHDQHGQV